MQPNQLRKFLEQLQLEGDFVLKWSRKGASRLTRFRGLLDALSVLCEAVLVQSKTASDEIGQDLRCGTEITCAEMNDNSDKYL